MTSTLIEEPASAVEDDVRLLVCENTACNPNLLDYDLAVSRFRTQGSTAPLRDHIRWMSAVLVHTPHVLGTQMYSRIHREMVDRWKCQVCGYSRRY